MNIHDVIRGPGGAPPATQAGIVLRESAGRYDIVIGGHRYLATLGVAGNLFPGDHVSVVLGRGEPLIVCKLGQEASTVPGT